MYRERWNHDKAFEKIRARLRSGATNCYTVAYAASDEKGVPCDEFNSGYFVVEHGEEVIQRNMLGAINNYTGKVVLSKRVRAETPYMAMRKFEKWQNEGLPDEFLTTV